MTEQVTNAQPVFSIQRAYLKGVSLEIPKGAETFLQEGNPNLELNLSVTPAELSEGIFEVSLRGTLTSKLGDTTLFLLEVDQAGIFEVRNIPADQMASVLEVGCPTILTPYLRAQVADVLTRATLPVFHLPEVNWMAMQAQRNAEQQQAALPRAANESVH